MVTAGSIRRRHSTDGSIQWALSKALDVLHQEIHPSSYCLIRMATKIASNLPAFFIIVDYLFANNHSCS